MLVTLMPFRVWVVLPGADYTEALEKTGTKEVVDLPEKVLLFVNRMHECKIQEYRDMDGQEYTVAGYDNGKYLLLKMGEVTRWVPEEYCIVSEYSRKESNGEHTYLRL